jgi:hypothetical protein
MNDDDDESNERRRQSIDKNDLKVIVALLLLLTFGIEIVPILLNNKVDMITYMQQCPSIC